LQHFFLELSLLAAATTILEVFFLALGPQLALMVLLRRSLMPLLGFAGCEIKFKGHYN
jgi:hypothetical protein